MMQKLEPQIELEYIKRAEAGDECAFTEIIEAYQNPVYNLCYRILCSHQAAEDAAQEAFWRIYKNLPRYDKKRSFATWILSIAAHHCIDLQRKKRLSTIDLNEIIEFAAEDPTPNPESSLQKNEFSEEVQRQLSRLNERDRAVLILRYWHEYSHAEISEALSISTSAVKSCLHRARKHLAQQWTAAEERPCLEAGYQKAYSEKRFLIS